MALSANFTIESKKSPVDAELKVVDGAIHIYQGGLLNYQASNIGYVKLGSDTLNEEFAGIAIEEKNLAAADNAADGTFSIRVITRGSGDWIKLPVTSNITIANEGDAVYVDGDDAVDISTGITNTTGGFVGIIRQFISTNLAWVQLTQHPTL